MDEPVPFIKKGKLNKGCFSGRSSLAAAGASEMVGMPAFDRERQHSRIFLKGKLISTVIDKKGLLLIKSGRPNSENGLVEPLFQGVSTVLSKEVFYSVDMLLLRGRGTLCARPTKNSTLLPVLDILDDSQQVGRESKRISSRAEDGVQK